MKAITIEKTGGKPGQVYYPLKLRDLPLPSPQPHEVTIKLHAASLNHRDHFIRQHLYPAISFTTPLLSDGVGTIVSTGASIPPDNLGKRVLIAPGRGWDSSPDGPESDVYAILGGTTHVPVGTLTEYICVPLADTEEVPLHLDAIEAAGLPLCGLTAYRAVFTKARVKAGQNVLITGIGGGVALQALSFCAAAGAVVFVTSGSEGKIRAAKELGASAGVCYRGEWERELRSLLPRGRPWLDAVIDGAGGDIVVRTVPLLKHGGRIVSYGMTLGPKTPFTMQAVLKNVEVVGSTMGSRREFAEMVEFVRDRQLRTVVSRVAEGISVESVESLFEDMKEGRQFGKLVVRISSEESAKL